VTVAGRPEPPLPVRPPERAVVFEAEVAFAWAQPAGIDGYRLQVAADRAFAAPIHDSVGPETARTVALPALQGASATWWWRVAAVAGTGAGARQGPFSEPRPLEQRPIGGAPAGSVDDSRLDLSWPALAGHRYRLQQANDPGFATPPMQRELTEPRTAIEELDPGIHCTRVRSIDPQGVASPFGPAQRFGVRFLLRSGAGAPVGSGGGAPVEPIARRLRRLEDAAGRIRDLNRRLVESLHGRQAAQCEREQTLRFLSHDLHDLAIEAADSCCQAATARGLRISTRLPGAQAEPALCRCDARLVRRALVNLIDDALRFGPPGSVVGDDIHASTAAGA
jgi:hypothetical protein